MTADEWWTWDSTLGSQAPGSTLLTTLPCYLITWACRKMSLALVVFGGLCGHQDVPQILEYWRGTWKLLNVAGGKPRNNSERMCGEWEE